MSGIMFGHSSSRKRKRSQRALAREEIIDELRLREKDFNQKYDYVYEDDGAPRRSRGGEEFIWPAGWTKLALVQTGVGARGCKRRPSLRRGRHLSIYLKLSNDSVW